MNDLIQCLQCQKWHLRIDKDRSHSWSVFDKKSGQPIVYDHQIGRCDDCGFELDECLSQKKEIIKSLDKSAELKDSVFTDLCDELRVTPKIQFTKIIYYLGCQNWKALLLAVQEFQSNERNHRLCVDFHSLFEILTTAIILLSNQESDSKEEIQKKDYNFTKEELSTEFVYDIVRLLTILKPKAIKDFEDFKARWFKDILIPFGITRDSLSKKLDENNELEQLVESFFHAEIVFEKLVGALLHRLVTHVTDKAQWPNDNVVLLESISKQIIPKKDNPHGNPIWYRVIKQSANELAFSILFKRQRYKEAFEYIEERGIDYIRRKEPPSGTEELEVTADGYPYRPDPNMWLKSTDVTESCYQCYYDEVWAITLRYLTLIDFYKTRRECTRDRDEITQIEDRILQLTDEYRNDDIIRKEVLNPRILPIVLLIYMARKNWQKVLDYIYLMRDSEKRDLFLDIFNLNINNELLNELISLDSAQQRQVLAYTMLIVKVEPMPRDFLRNKLSLERDDWEAEVTKHFPGQTKKRKEEEGLYKLQTRIQRKDILEWLTFPELTDLLLKDDNWKLFKNDIGKQEEWQAARSILNPIRISIAHAILLEEFQVQNCIDQSNKILKLIKVTKS